MALRVIRNENGTERSANFDLAGGGLNWRTKGDPHEFAGDADAAALVIWLLRQRFGTQMSLYTETIA